VTTSANIELLRGFGNALNAHDIEAILAYCDPNIAFHSGIGAIHGVYHGHDGVRRWHRDNREVWGEEIRAEPEAVFDLGEHTLTFYVARGRGQRSGVEVAMPGAAVVRWRNGLITYIKSYRDREDALRDLGVTEDELEQLAVTDSPNVDLVRSIYADWERGNFSRADWASPEIEFVVPEGPTPGAWKGLDAMAEVSRYYLDSWKGYRMRAEAYRELDDGSVLVTDRRIGRGKTSGLDLGHVPTQGTSLWHVRDGKVTRLVLYYYRDRALADLGLEE
jgi:ketosteroid isomerase-like protein